MIGAVSRFVPRFAGSALSGLRRVLPATPGEAAFSFLPDLGFAALNAAMAPGSVPEIGFPGASPAERAGIGAYELFVNGLAPSLGGRLAGRGVGRLFGAKNYGGLMNAGEMAAQMTFPMLVPNPITSGIYERLQSAQEGRNKELIEAEIQERLRRLQPGRDPSSPAANNIRPMSDGYPAGDPQVRETEDPQVRQMRTILAGAGFLDAF
jgi:hypothetical protein